MTALILALIVTTLTALALIVLGLLAARQPSQPATDCALPGNCNTDYKGSRWNGATR